MEILKEYTIHIDLFSHIHSRVICELDHNEKAPSFIFVLYTGALSPLSLPMVKRIKHIFAPLCTFASVTALLTGCAGKQPENTPPTTAPIDGAAKPSSRIPTPAPASQAPVSAEPSTSAEVESYRDGSYAATGTYRSPAGEESVNVTLTLTKGVITAATYQGTATNQKSIMFQKKFGDAYEEQVVGKPINDLSLEVINGSSLTPAGFMNAVARIKVEAAGS